MKRDQAKLKKEIDIEAKVNTEVENKLNFSFFFKISFDEKKNRSRVSGGQEALAQLRYSSVRVAFFLLLIK